MKTLPRYTIRPSALTMTLLALSAPALAAEPDEVTELSKPESSISLGIGYASDDSRRFGQYTGITEEGGYGLADISIANRNDDTGTWILLEGRNLGLDNRDLRDGKALARRFNNQGRDNGQGQRNLDAEIGAFAFHRLHVDGAANFFDQEFGDR